MKFFRVYADLLDDRAIQQLPPEEFKEEFIKAMHKWPSKFDDFISEDFGRMPWAEWRLIRSYIFERDSYTCKYCGASGVRLEVDHIVAVSKGGSNDKTNLVTACVPCNRKKSDKSLEELGWEIAA